MDNSSPLTSQSLSKENDSIDDASAAAKQAAERRAGKSEDDFEDSLNVSISEHISEEIGSNNNSSAVDDSIERPPMIFNQSIAEKKRQLFDFDDSDRSDARDGGGDGDGIRMFSNFNLEESLSGGNIAKHFATETAETATAGTSTAAITQSDGSVNEPVASQNISQRTIKSDELKIADANEGAANVATATSMAAMTTTATPIHEATTSSKTIDEMQKSKDSSNLIELTQQSSASDSRKSVSDDKTNGKNDVILINDREISIHSLMELQRQPSRTDIANQNTTSDISDLQAEDNAKEQRSIDDISTNESSEKVESHSATIGDVEMERSKSVSDKVQSDPKSDSHSEKHETSTNASEENIQKCRPIEEDEASMPEPLSVIEEVSVADEHSSHHQLIESNSDKKIEMRKIIDETVSKLPLDKENRPPGDDMLSIGSKYLGSSQNSTTTDGTVYTAFGKSSEVPPILPTNFGDDFNLNLIKNKELQNVAGKGSTTSYFDFPLISSSRRDSLKDFAQSGRESSSITTNSTEYQAFQEEFTRVSILKIAVFGIFGRSIHIEIF